MFALMRKRFLVKGLENNLDLLLEELTVGRLIEQRRAKRLYLASMIATSYTKGDAPASKDIGHGKILSEPQRMPHGGDVEAAADMNTLGHVGQVHGHHQHIGNALVAFGLKVMLRHPEGRVPQTIHELRHGLCFAKDRCQMFVGEAAVIHGCAAIAHIVHINVAGKQTIKFCNHVITSRGEWSMVSCPIVVWQNCLSNQNCPPMTLWCSCCRLLLS